MTIARILLLLCALGGATQAWAYRHVFNADGIAYLDLGDAWMRGDWKAAVSSYWSPLYSIFLGIANVLTGHQGQNELVVAHAVNLVLLLAALAAFHLLVSRCLELFRAEGLYRLSLQIGGYSLFLYSVLEMQTIRNVGADIGLLAVVYLAAASMAGWVKDGPTTRSAIELGVVLGIGYWMKAAMLPIGVLFLLAAIASGRGVRANRRAAGIAVAAFLVVCLPWIATMSVKVGHPSLGDNGRLNYAFLVNGVDFTHWQTSAIHPTRRIHTGPDAFEFAEPVAGTYPPWDDPSYWNDGVSLQWSSGRQLQVLETSAAFLARLFTRPLLPWTLLIVLIALLARRSLAAMWWLALPSALAIGIYAPIFIESRYIAPFIGLLLWSLTAAADRPLIHYVRLAAGALTFALIAYFLIQVTRSAPGPASEQVALAIEQQGLQAGDPVAVVNDGARHYWARLARARVVAEIPKADQLLAAPADQREAALHALEAAGAKWIVSSVAVPDTASYSWRSLPGTTYFLMVRQP